MIFFFFFFFFFFYLLLFLLLVFLQVVKSTSTAGVETAKTAAKVAALSYADANPFEALATGG